MGSEQMIKVWSRSGSPSGYRDCFPDSSLLEIRKVVINGHKSAAYTDSPDAALVRRALAEECTVPVLI